MFFCISIVTPLCIYLELNSNYVISPPPTPGDIIGGANYQLILRAAISIVFGIIRLIKTVTEFVTRY